MPPGGLDGRGIGSEPEWGYKNEDGEHRREWHAPPPRSLSLREVSAEHGSHPTACGCPASTRQRWTAGGRTTGVGCERGPR